MGSSLCEDNFRMLGHPGLTCWRWAHFAHTMACSAHRNAWPIDSRAFYHIDRGYERIEEKLSSVGARIRRVS